MRYEFDYDEISDMLKVSSPGMKHKEKVEKVSCDNFSALYLDTFTQEIVGARIAGLKWFLGAMKRV